MWCTRPYHIRTCTWVRASAGRLDVPCICASCFTGSCLKIFCVHIVSTLAVQCELLLLTPVLQNRCTSDPSHQAAAGFCTGAIAGKQLIFHCPE